MRALVTQRQETVFLDGEGRPRHVSARCESWFDHYFPDEFRRAGLPKSVCRWVEDARAQRQHQSAACAVLEPLKVARLDAVLEIHWFADEQGSQMLLLTEKGSLFGAETHRVLGLTRREAEVLRWMAEGKTDREMARILEMSEHTAHKHVQHILRKFGVSNRATALLRAFELTGMV